MSVSLLKYLHQAMEDDRLIDCGGSGGGGGGGGGGEAFGDLST